MRPLVPTSVRVVVKKTIHAVCDQLCTNLNVSPSKQSGAAFGTMGATHEAARVHGVSHGSEEARARESRAPCRRGAWCSLARMFCRASACQPLVHVGLVSWSFG